MVLTVGFVLDGQQVTAINGGPEFTFDEAISFMVDCADQEEVDYYWEAPGRRRRRTVRMAQGPLRPLVADRPAEMGEIMTNPDPVKANKAMQAMLGMSKLDVAALRAVADAG